MPATRRSSVNTLLQDYFLANMRVFALWPVVFWKYVFILLEYVVLKKMYFRKSYVNVSTSKYVCLKTNTPKYAYSFVLLKSRIRCIIFIRIKNQNTPMYSYLRIRLNTLLYVVFVFMRKYARLLSGHVAFIWHMQKVRANSICVMLVLYS